MPTMALPRPSAKLPPSSAEICDWAPSPSKVSPDWASTVTPWKLCLSLKFTTPATASAPYVEPAPPVMISTLSIAAVGMVFRSTARLALIGCVRRPSSSTRVRLGPRPRRFTVEPPGLLVAVVVMSPLLVFWFWPATNCGSRESAWSIPTWEVFCRVWADTVTMGLSEEKSRRAMREPVTTTSSTSSDAAALLSCASAG
jgi:hypothetical protein